MKISKELLLTKLTSYSDVFKRYRVFAFSLIFLGIYTFLILQINVLTQKEPSATAIDDSQKTIQRLKIDQTSVNKMLQLEDQNIEVKALFEQARNNPFSE